MLLVGKITNISGHWVTDMYIWRLFANNMLLVDKITNISCHLIESLPGPLLLYWLSFPDKGNQEKFSDCQTSKELKRVSNK